MSDPKKAFSANDLVRFQEYFAPGLKQLRLMLVLFNLMISLKPLIMVQYKGKRSMDVTELYIGNI
jgi:hypothetical protein